MNRNRIQPILDYWCLPRRHPHWGRPRAMWFSGAAKVDAEMRQLFTADIEHALQGRYEGWIATARGALAYCLLLDQFTRNIHRGSARAFAGDRRALAAARRALARGFDRQFPPELRKFFYMPFEHSESLGDQQLCIGLMSRILPAASVRWAVQHREIVARFGRFPHRNAALERPSTAAELAYLADPHHRFGQ